jgi:hypothetical protein
MSEKRCAYRSLTESVAARVNSPPTKQPGVSNSVLQCVPVCCGV